MQIVNLICDSQEPHVLARTYKNNGSSTCGCLKCKSRAWQVNKPLDSAHCLLKSATDRCAFASCIRTKDEYRKVGYQPVGVGEVPLGGPKSGPDPCQAQVEDTSHLHKNTSSHSWERCALEIPPRDARILFDIMCDCTQETERKNYLTNSALSQDTKSIKQKSLGLQQAVPLLVVFPSQNCIFY